MRRHKAMTRHAWIPLLCAVLAIAVLTVAAAGNGRFRKLKASLFTVVVSVLPLADDSVDLGSASKEFKDAYIDGTANIDTAAITTGSFSASFVPSADNTVDLGSSAAEFKDGYFDGTVNADALVADTADINGGTVDGASLGAASPVGPMTVGTGGTSIDTINIGSVTLTNATSATVTIAGFAASDVAVVSYDGAPGTDDTELWATPGVGYFLVGTGAATTSTINYIAVAD